MIDPLKHVQEEECSNELANHGDEMVAGSIGNSLEESNGFGLSHFIRDERRQLREGQSQERRLERGRGRSLDFA